jgi:PilZ domain-containing protein
VAVLRLHAVWNASPQVFTSLAVFRMSDRRRDKRWDVCLDAVWDRSGTDFTARVTDLSEGGCYIDSLTHASVGETLNLKLQLSNGDSLELTGEVAHQSPPLGFGLRFVDLTEEQLEKLLSFIEHLKRTHEPVSAIMSY